MAQLKGTEMAQTSVAICTRTQRMAIQSCDHASGLLLSEWPFLMHCVRGLSGCAGGAGEAGGDER